MDEVIDSDERKHYLKPEQEVRNYFLALNYLKGKEKELLLLLMKNYKREFTPIEGRQYVKCELRNYYQ